MKITNEQIRSLSPCRSGWEWYIKNGQDTYDLKALLLKVNDNHPAWARWTFTELMTKEQCVEIAIFAAAQVLSIFEDKYPDDDRPRKAIEAAKNYLKNSSDKNRAYAAAAAAAAYAAAADADADADAYADAAAYAAATAAAAAYAADDAAYAADDAADDADDAAAAAAAAYAYAYAADADADIKAMQEKIICEAVRILDRGNR